MPRMSEFIEELQEKMRVYGDYDVVAADDTDPAVEFIEEDDPVFVIS